MIFLFFWGSHYHKVFSQRQIAPIEYSLKSGKTGSAFVTYRIIDGAKLPDGKFEFVRDSIIDSDNGLVYHTTSYSGIFKQGIKNGRWNYEHSLLSPQKEGRTDGRNIVHDSDGTLRHVGVTFSEGLANGAALVYQVAIQNSNYADTSYSNTVLFNQGFFADKLVAKNNNKNLIIPFGQEGEINGELILLDKNSGKKIENIKRFEGGVLKSHKIILDGKEFELGYIELLNNINRLDSSNYRVVSVSLEDERYTLLSKLAIRCQNASKKDNIDWSKILLRGEQFVLNAVNDYATYEGSEIWQELPGSSAIKGPFVKLIERDYPEEDKSQLEALKSKLLESKQILSFYFADPNLEFNRFMSEDMAFNYEVLSQLNTAIETVNNVVDFCLDFRTRYFDRDKALPMFYDPINFNPRIQFDYGDKKLNRNYDFPEGFNWLDFNVGTLEKNSLRIMSKIQELDTLMRPEVKMNQQQLKIIDKEKELLGLKDSIVFLFSQENKKANSYHVKYGPSISAFVQSEFKRYAAQQVKTRMESIDPLLHCYNLYLESYEELKKLEDRVKHLETLYTRTTWNPFTFTDMDEIVKERLYNAYRISLLNFVLEDLFGNPECGRLDDKLDNFSKIYRRMLELREQDTKEIERMLKRVTSPKQIAEILQINLIF